MDGLLPCKPERSMPEPISGDFIAAQVPNVLFGAPGQPPTLRLVPQEMTMPIHMAGLM